MTKHPVFLGYNARACADSIHRFDCAPTERTNPYYNTLWKKRKKKTTSDTLLKYISRRYTILKYRVINMYVRTNVLLVTTCSSRK